LEVVTYKTVAGVPEIAQYLQMTFGGMQKCKDCNAVAPPEGIIIDVVKPAVSPETLLVVRPRLYIVPRMSSESHAHTVTLGDLDPSKSLVPIFVASMPHGDDAQKEHFDWRCARKAIGADNQEAKNASDRSG